MHQTVNGLLAKGDLITEHLDTLSNNWKCVHILCFTEHNMKQGDYDILNIPNSPWLQASRGKGEMVGHAS